MEEVRSPFAYECKVGKYWVRALLKMPSEEGQRRSEKTGLEMNTLRTEYLKSKGGKLL